MQTAISMDAPLKSSRFRRNIRTATLIYACALVLVLPIRAAAAQIEGSIGTKSVIGTSSNLTDGAMALMVGNYQRGVELTWLGLQEVLSPEDRAISLSNLCAGYVGLKEYDVALVYCKRSLEIIPANWRALQNRAAAYSGLGKLPEALQDIKKGLAINPDSEALKLTLAIVREQERSLPQPPATRSASRP